MKNNIRRALVAFSMLTLLYGCGGGGGDSATSGGTSVRGTNQAPGGAAAGGGSQTPSTPAGGSDNTGAPAGTNTGTDTGSSAGAATPVTLSAEQQTALTRLNYYRNQAGIASVTPNAALVKAASAHAAYVSATDEVGHHETLTGNPFYTGYDGGIRMSAAGYGANIWGEVVTRTSSLDVTTQVDLLMMAIYHRFPMLSRSLAEVGVGVASKSSANDLTIDLGTKLFPAPTQTLVTYPTNGQSDIPLDFNPATESPNPAPGYSLVGYPVSIQGDYGTALKVTSFTLTDVRTGSDVAVRLLSSASDANTPEHAAAIIPLAPLDAGSTYLVNFSGSLDNTPVSRTWQFTTATAQATTISFSPASVTAGASSTVTLKNLDSQRYSAYRVCYNPTYVQSLTFSSLTTFTVATKPGSCAGSSCSVPITVATDGTCSTVITSGTLTVTP